MPPRFISQPIEAVAGTFDASAMARGEPGVPQRFRWENQEYKVGQTLETWITSGASGCGETYLRRHWAKVRTTTGQVMVLYCERQTKYRDAKAR